MKTMSLPIYQWQYVFPFKNIDTGKTCRYFVNMNLSLEEFIQEMRQNIEEDFELSPTKFDLVLADHTERGPAITIQPSTQHIPITRLYHSCSAFYIRPHDSVPVSTECPVCWETSNSCFHGYYQCSHDLCETCFNHWNGGCPLCRAPIGHAVGGPTST